jgi:phosphate transport system ATP-binding protein
MSASIFPESVKTSSTSEKNNESESNVFIRIRNLNLFYRQKQALSNVTMDFDWGGITALIGPSGCGKTSFLMCINRLIDLIPGTRATGSIQVGNMDVLNPQMDIIRLRRCVGMIFQKPNPFPLSIKRNLELPLKEKGITDKHAIEETVIKSLNDVGLWKEVKDRLNAPALALSGGQQQRLCIARALVLTPGVLLFDEPCSALDPISSSTVEELILSLKDRYTVVVVTHNLAQAKRMADSVGLFWTQDEAGQLIEAGPTQQIFENPQHELTAAYVHGIRG